MIDSRSDIYIRGFFTIILFVAIMIVLNSYFSGIDRNPDWLSYQIIYSDDGGYLARKGRDPTFVWLVSVCHRLLGDDGYDEFRAIFFGVVIAVVSLVGTRIPYRSTSILVAVTVLLSVFCAKSIIQIRECIAFMVVVIGFSPLFRRGSWIAAIVAGASAGLAMSIHSGAILFVITWVLMVVFCLLSPRLRFMPTLLTIGGMAAGLLLSQNAHLMFDYMLDNFGDVSRVSAIEPVSGVAKYVNSVLALLNVVVIRSQLLLSARANNNRLAYGFSLSLGAVVIPALFMADVILVYSSFAASPVTSALGRALATSTEAAILFTTLSGRANWLTLGTAAFTLAGQLRALMLGAMLFQ